jgi:hypothetical protein
VLAAELADAMVELVCGRFVIEGRHCHCDDDEGPVRTNLPREGSVALAGESPEITSSEGRHDDWLRKMRVGGQRDGVDTTVPR